MSESSDEELMKSYQEGNADAFDALYERYRTSVYGYFNRHVADPSTANDLYQGCWEKLIRARTRYNSKAPFRAWLFRIAHNHLVDHYRAQRKTVTLPETLADERLLPQDRALDEAQQQQRLQTALRALPEEQRDALILRLENGLDVETIGQVTGVGTETAKSRLRYATKKLKQVLQR